MITILFAAGDHNWPVYEPVLAEALKERGIAATLTRSAMPEDVDYIIYAPSSSLQDFRPFTRCKAVMNLWAGVERIVGNETLTQPLTRMADTSLREGMCEWVAGHVLRHHLGLDRYIVAAEPSWQQIAPPLARDRKVTILGLGELGMACAVTLAGLGFDVTGWSRSPKEAEGIRCLSGESGLETALRGADIAVLLLPLTAATENLMNEERLGWLAPGAALLNPGRGALIDDRALLAALDSGALGHATLDVFRVEPLPADHPFWAHPKVTVTPHIASETRPTTASAFVADNIRRSEAGEPLLNVVDRALGY